jgi:PhnB protein
MKIETYIFFTDQCAQAMRFYEKVLGGKIEAMMTYGDSPAGPHNPPEMAHKVIHARLTVGNAVLMASDGPEAETRKGFAVTLQVDTIAEADKLFNALSEGATITMPIGETFFSKRFGMLTDKFGVPWMVNCVQAM